MSAYEFYSHGELADMLVRLGTRDGAQRALLEEAAHRIRERKAIDWWLVVFYIIAQHIRELPQTSDGRHVSSIDGKHFAKVRIFDRFNPKYWRLKIARNAYMRDQVDFTLEPIKATADTALMDMPRSAEQMQRTIERLVRKDSPFTPRDCDPKPPLPREPIEVPHAD